MGNIGMFALLLLICAGSSSSAERAGRLLAGNLMKQCSVDCKGMTAGNVALVPFFCFILFPDLSDGCPEPSPPGPPGPPGRPGAKGAKGDMGRPACPDPMVDCHPEGTMTLSSIDGRFPLIKEYILNNREYIVLKKLSNDTLVRVDEVELKEAFDSFF